MKLADRIMKDLTELAKKYLLGIVLCIVVMISMNYLFGTVCTSTILLGLPCPACGITRATILMLTGHFNESFQMHPLLLLVFVEFIFCIIIKKILKNYRFYINISVIICLAIFVCFYIYRMSEYFPNIEPLVYRSDNILRKTISLYRSK